MSTTQTLHQVIESVAEQLAAQPELSYGHGTDNAWDEAVYLVSYAANLGPDLYRIDPETLLDELQCRAIDDLLQRRIAERVPVAYLVGVAWFAGLPFYVNRDALIPRSPLAELIADQFAPWIAAPHLQRVLDIGTGSGCIAIAAAVHLPHARVDATDVSNEALALARRNVERHGVGDRVRLVQSDVFDGLGSEAYDLIISNPPYVDQQDMDALPAEFRHEPALGLEAGPDGLRIVRRILAEAGDYLTDRGLLIVEVGNSADALEQAYPTVPFTWLEFERGGEGVFMLEAAQLKASAASLKAGAIG